MNLSVVILAAGQGTRMKSRLPKVLHRLAHLTLLEHVQQSAARLQPHAIYAVYGHGGETVPQRLAHLEVHWIEQAQQLGTGHAVAQVLPLIPDDDQVLVLYGDVPLIRAATLDELVTLAAPDHVALLTVELDDPTGYGRIQRDAEGRVAAIVEHKDADANQRAIREVNTGIMALPARRLRDWIARLDNSNAQGEYYLTDVIAAAVADGVAVHTVASGSVAEVSGINDREQLAALERHYQSMNAQQLMQAGVTLRDPQRFDLRGELRHGTDVSIDVNVIVEGSVVLGDNVTIGPNVVLRDVTIGDDVTIDANCVIEQAVIGAGARIGPFARIRPETELAANVHVGNFVEIKKSTIGEGSKINHLSYVGDTTMGARVNIGAGTITCNYDGAYKHQTLIGDDVFVGSDTQLVAPVQVGDGATIGAGSTITQNPPAGQLTLSRAKQTTVKGWTRPQKKPS